MARKSGGSLALELFCEVRGHIRVYLDTALAVIGGAERSTLAHALHKCSLTERKRDLHALPARDGLLAQLPAKCFDALPRSGADKHGARELARQRLTHRIALRTAERVRFVERDERRAISEVERLQRLA